MSDTPRTDAVNQIPEIGWEDLLTHARALEREYRKAMRLIKRHSEGGYYERILVEGLMNKMVELEDIEEDVREL